MALEVIKVNDGTTTPVAFDVVGTTYEQVIKLDISADGAASPTLYDGKVQGGTINAATAVVSSGSIAVTAGTIASGSIVVTVGTVIMPSGTVTSVTDIANLSKGTITKLEGGTLGLITRVGNIGTLEFGTISALPNIPGGTINVVAAGTINSATVVLNSGTISVLPNLPQGSINVTAGTITAGSIRVTLGTVVGAVASGAAASGGPVLTGGTDPGGTVYANLLDTSGRLHTVTEIGTVSSLPNIPGGTLGLVTTVTTVSNISNGTIRVTEGTIAAGTVGGKAASGAAASGNPVLIGGTDPGGTVYAGLLDTSGRLHTVTEVGTISSIPNITLAGGTVQNLNAGTITRVSTIGTLEVGTIVMTNGTIGAGTVQINPKPSKNIFNFGTTTTGTIGTLIAAPGSGTSVWINEVSANVLSGTAEVLVSWGLSTTGGGAAGGGPILRGLYPAGGGHEKPFAVPVNGGTSNVAVTYNILSGSGTVSYGISYWVE